MNGFGEALAGLMSGMMIIIGILAVISIFGIWKLFDIRILDFYSYSFF
jgi:hypothetical protein